MNFLWLWVYLVWYFVMSFLLTCEESDSDGSVFRSNISTFYSHPQPSNSSKQSNLETSVGIDKMCGSKVSSDKVMITLLTNGSNIIKSSLDTSLSNNIDTSLHDNSK